MGVGEEERELVPSWMRGRASTGRFLWDGTNEVGCQTQRQDWAIPEVAKVTIVRTRGKKRPQPQ